MDLYVVKEFLSPFSFCMMAFTSIWLIFDFTDNGPAFSGLPFSRLAEFYVVQFPYVILFVLPIVILLSLLFALSTQSSQASLGDDPFATASCMIALRVGIKEKSFSTQPSPIEGEGVSRLFTGSSYLT